MLMLTGCGGADKDKPTLAKVTGKVTYKGKPLTSGSVIFTPIAGKGGETGQTATGEVASDGTYELTTFNTGDGAILGQHTVTVTVPEKGSEDMGKPDANGRLKYVPAKSVTPSKYSKVDTSPLKCTVVEGGTTFDIDLKD